MIELLDDNFQTKVHQLSVSTKCMRINCIYRDCPLKLKYTYKKDEEGNYKKITFYDKESHVNFNHSV